MKTQAKQLMPLRVLFLALVVAAITALERPTAVGADAAEAVIAKAELAGRLSLGALFTCAVVDGTVYCWGDNQSGQTGQSSGYVNKTPAQVSGISNATQVSAGFVHACALLATGEVTCWGSNTGRQLGRSTGSENFSTAPQVVAGVSGAVGVATGFTHSCALLSNGTAKCWGENANGQLGRGSTGAATMTPALVTGLSNGARIVAAKDRTCVLTTTGGVTCWGYSTKGVMGAGEDPDDLVSGLTSPIDYPTPVQVVKNAGLVPLTGMTSVSLSDDTGCALATDGTAWCWGNDMYSQIGSGLGYMIRGAIQFKAPNQAQPLTDIQQISMGDYYTCMVRAAGVPWCIGSNMGGQLGDGTQTYSFTARLKTVVEVAKTTAIVAATNHTCSIDVDMVVYCWGTGTGGQIGHGTFDNAFTPVVVSGAAPQAITFAALTDRALDAGDLTITASAASGQQVSFTSSTPVVCTVSGSTVKAVSVGTCTIKASRATYGLYAAATDVSRSFEVTGIKPVVATGAASPTSSKATLAGTVNSGGVDASIVFTYGTNPTLSSGTTTTTAVTKKNVAAEEVTAEISGLVGSTTYYYRLEASNSIGSATGDIKSFSTKGSKPTARTGSATPSTTKATLNATINPNDVETSVKFEYGTAADLKGAASVASASRTGSDEVDVSVVVSDLAEKTTYYYRVVATNAVGTTTGEIKSFSTTRPEGVSVNDGDEFAKSQKVTVSVVGSATAAKAILSNDGGFKTSETVDLIKGSAEVPWTLQSTREGTFTKIVYVRFVSRFGSTLSTQSDDIILDTTKPVMTTATAAAAAPTGSAVTVSRIGAKAKASGGVRLSLRGSDTISGIGTIEVRSAANKPAAVVTIANVAGKADGKPRAASQTVTLRTTANRLQVRVIDRAGNASAWRTIVVK